MIKVGTPPLLSNHLAALNSINFLRDPFPVVDGSGGLSMGSDRNTRVVIFVRNLTIGPGETSSSVMVNLIDQNNQSYDLAAEDVRSVANFDFAQIIFRLPNNPAAGKGTIKVSAHGQTSNSGVITISN